MKVEIYQLVVSRVTGPHGYKYLPGGMKLMFHRPFIGWDPAGNQKFGTHTLGEDLEETYGVPDTLEVVWDTHTSAEFTAFAPGS